MRCKDRKAEETPNLPRKNHQSTQPIFQFCSCVHCAIIVPANRSNERRFVMRDMTPAASILSIHPSLMK